MSDTPNFVPGRGNLSRWAIVHPALLRFFILLLLLVGVRSYFHLGQAEDPPFTFKVMLSQAYWPGATAQEVSEQLTERIEKKLQEMPELDFVHSFAKPGETALFVKKEIYGKRLVLLAPLYVSNMCNNECLYCAFRRSNTQITRRTLSMDEILPHARELKGIDFAETERLLMVRTTNCSSPLPKPRCSSRKKSMG